MRNIITLGAALAVLSAPALAAPQQCNQRDEVLKLLSHKYSEAPVAFGVTNNGGLVEVLTSTPSAKDDTWTIIITTPQGVSCLVAAGEGWRGMEQMALDPET
jgi:hypothetical protein